MNRRRWQEIIITLFLGDALITLVWPRQHMRLWRDVLPFKLWRSGVRWCEDHPTVLRGIAVLEGGVMLRWAGRIYHTVSA